MHVVSFPTNENSANEHSLLDTPLGPCRKQNVADRRMDEMTDGRGQRQNGIHLPTQTVRESIIKQ